MTRKPAKPQQRPEQGTVQPVTREHVKKTGVPDEQSSKMRSTPERDGRSGHDKDGNQEQLRKSAGGRRS